MDGETTIVVAGTPNAEVPDEGEGEGWQSELSEVITTNLQSGFSGLREEFRSELTTLRESNSNLLQSNTALTGQVTEMARSILERLPALTPPATPELVVIAPVELPQENVADENQVVETSQVETPPAETRRKRRTL